MVSWGIRCMKKYIMKSLKIIYVIVGFLLGYNCPEIKKEKPVQIETPQLVGNEIKGLR